jgi:D-amino-acid dehydrogenase
VPALALRIETLAGGIHFAGEEGGDCFKFTEALAAWCREHGAVLGFGTTVERLEAEGARITSVHTSRGSLVADAYVLALGADSPLVMRPHTRCVCGTLGVRLPIIPVKGYSLTVPKARFP